MEDVEEIKNQQINNLWYAKQGWAYLPNNNK